MDAEIDYNLGLTEPRSSGDQTSEEEEAQAQLVVFYPNRQPVPYKLHLGVNVIGRQSSFAQRDAVRLHDWSLEYTGVNVHGIFLESSSISSAHAALYLEGWGEHCFVKDLGSRNKTFVRRAGKLIAVQPEQRQLLQCGDLLTFGALKSRISFGSGSEGAATPSGGSPAARSSSPLFQATVSRAISIGQRTVSPGTPTGKPGSLDKCPSLQEWFQHPARLGHGGVQASQSPFSGISHGRGWSEEESGSGPLELVSKPSFGFEATIPEAEENTSSDAEPETPRIDKPLAFHSPKMKPSPFIDAAGLAPMLEEENEENPEETSIDIGMQQAEEANNEKELGPSRSSLEMGAQTLTQLRTVPLKGSIAGEPRSPPAVRTSAHPQLPETPGTEDISPSPLSSPGTSPDTQPWVATPSTAQPADDQSGRPRHVRQKSPTPKRSRSGRVVSPDKTQPRSKSPRLQRGFYVDSEPSAMGERRMEMGEIREAMRDIWTDTGT